VLLYSFFPKSSSRNYPFIELAHIARSGFSGFAFVLSQLDHLQDRSLEHLSPAGRIRQCFSSLSKSHQALLSPTYPSTLGALSRESFRSKGFKKVALPRRSLAFSSLPFLLFLALYVKSRRTSRTPFKMSTEKLASQLLISKELVIAFLSILIWDFVNTPLSSSARFHVRNRDTDESFFLLD